MAPKLSQPPKHPNNIRKVIQQSPWKLYEVADKMHIPKGTLIDYCSGEYPIPSDRLQALAEFLDCVPEYLVPPLPNVRAAYTSGSESEETKDLEALLVLRMHCQAHPTDENGLQQLMELLGTFGRYREIEVCYERFLKEVKKVNIWRKPDADTTKLLTQFRAQAALESEKGEQTVAPSEAGAEDPATDTPEPCERDKPRDPVPFEPPQAQRIGETVFLTIALPSSTLQALAQESPSGLSTLDTSASPQTPPSTSLPDLTSPPSQSVSPQGIILARGDATAHSPNARNLRDSYLTSSTDIVGSLKAYSSLCQGDAAACRQQIDIYETIGLRRTMKDEHIIDPSQITRRDLLTLTIVSPLLLTSIRRGWLSTVVMEEFLSEVTASITTCWYLLQGDGLSTVALTLPQYFPELVYVVKFSSRDRQRAAYLAAQGFLLYSLIDLHSSHFAERVANCQKAVTHANEAGDLTLLVACLVHLSDAFLTNGQPDKSLDTCLQAESYSKGLSGFLRSKLLTKSAHADAQQGKSQGVIRYLNEANAIFTEADDETPVFLNACCGLFEIILDEGLSTLDLGNHEKKQGNLDRAQKHYKEAAKKLGRIEKLSSDIVIPQRIYAEIEIKRALAAVLAGELEEFIKRFTNGARLAMALGSEKRKQEAREALKIAIERWPNDQRITGLWELLI